MAQQQPTTHISTLELIKEKVLNIDRTQVKRNIKLIIDEAISIMAHREERLRKSTITLTIGSNLSREEITNEIIKKYDDNHKPIFWQDKTKLFIKLQSEDAKNQFLDELNLDLETATNNLDIASLVMPPDVNGYHYTRKPIKLIINNIKANFKVDDLSQQLSAYKIENAKFEEFREGKLNKAGIKVITFRTNAQGFDFIFDNLSNCINIQKRNNLKVWPKINVRPWTCRDCFQLGFEHKCKGKLCANCGGNNHKSNDCKTTTRICSNCSLRGHRAKDIQCPKFLTAVIKELQRSDVPVKYYTQKSLRAILTTNLQLS